MPKAPILSRECYYDVRRDGSFVDLDWNLVNTSLGAMVEPAMQSVVLSPVVQLDLDDMVSFNRRVQMDETVMFGTLGTAGIQVPSDYNTQ